MKENKNNNVAISAEEIKLYRLAMLSALLLTPLFYLFAHEFSPFDHDPLWVRLIIAGISLIFIVSSYVSRGVKRAIVELVLIYAIVYTGWLHINYVLNGFHFFHLICILLFAFGSSLIIKRPKYLVIYNVFTFLFLAIALTISAASGNGWLEIIFPFVSIAFTTLFCFYWLKTGWETSEKLNEQKEVLEALVDNAIIGIVTVDFDGNLIDVNDYFAQTLGYSKDELKRMTVYDITHEDDIEKSTRIIEKSANRLKGDIKVFEKKYKKKDGTTIYGVVKQKPIYNKFGRPDKMLATINNVTEQRKAEETNILFQQALDISPNGIIVTDTTDQRIIESNNTFCQMLGYTKEEMLQLKVSDIDVGFVIGDKEARKKAVQSLKTLQKPLHIRSKHQRKDGTIFPVDVSVRRVKIMDQEYYVTAIKDISEMLKIEEKLKKSVNTEILLKEIHHRVKNNLQIVSSLLSLQSSKSKDPDIIAQNEQTMRRIMSMSLIHEMLYDSNSLATISSKKYIHELLIHISNSSFQEKEVKIEQAVDDFEIDLDFAIPIGLILTELITNSYKHAFNNQDNGLIKVTVIGNKTGTILTYQDNGTGFERGCFKSKNTLGSTLILSLNKQLNGEIVYENKNGFYCQITIPIKPEIFTPIKKEILQS